MRLRNEKPFKSSFFWVLVFLACRVRANSVVVLVHQVVTRWVQQEFFSSSWRLFSVNYAFPTSAEPAFNTAEAVWRFGQMSRSTDR